MKKDLRNVLATFGSVAVVILSTIGLHNTLVRAESVSAGDAFPVQENGAPAAQNEAASARAQVEAIRQAIAAAKARQEAQSRAALAASQQAVVMQQQQSTLLQQSQQQAALRQQQQAQTRRIVATQQTQQTYVYQPSRRTVAS
jgi:uncharacterized iron-regulated membrane protein